jgi:hypothetical protein
MTANEEARYDELLAAIRTLRWKLLVAECTRDEYERRLRKVYEGKTHPPSVRSRRRYGSQTASA